MHICMHICMTKIISLSDDAYTELKKLKAGLSFSKIVLELAMARKKNAMINYAGVWDKEFAEKIKKQIYKERKMKSRRFE